MKAWLTLVPLVVLLLVPEQSAGADFDPDGDGDVDLTDYQDFEVCLTGPNVPASPQCASNHDSDGDADVDLADFRAFQLAFTGPAPIIRTQLAGNPLGNYPFFDYVRAFNENATVNIAIDPARFPYIVGQTCDLYVVDAKTQPQWTADPSLVDVTSGGARTEIFGGSAIQDNTFLVAESGELGADAGSGLGAGYDIVLDCDRNGQLTSGDYIDGGSEEAGLYVVHDTTQPGPLDVTVIEYSGGPWLGQRTFFPTDITLMGQLPLVVISHGWTHQYTYYDHIGYHLASYGYVVMSHTNDVGNGGAAATETASTTTLMNTDYIIGNQDTIGGSVLDGHLDAHRITWIGHSTGGEGVVRAHTRLRTGDFVPTHYDINDVVLISSIAPVAFLAPSAVTPANVNYHMFIGAADTDTSGAPLPAYVQSMAIYERGFGNKQLIYVQGAGHADFHDGGGSSWAEGPDLIGREATHTVVKGYYLPLLELYAKDNIAAKDFFTRMYEGFRPIGIPSYVVIAKEYKDAQATGNVVLDDYQTQPDLAVSSSGGAVSYDVEHLDEVLMADVDGSFEWTGDQPSNGMTRYRYSGDDPHCAVMDWAPSSPASYELELTPDLRDVSDRAFLSFRTCQGTRHPETVALDGPLSFTVTLRDGTGTTSSIDFANYGHITRPYQRTGFGAGAGWGNEFSSVRLRLTDFLTNGSGLDLTDVAAVRFDFGAVFGSGRGRIGLDDIELTHDRLPTISVTISLPDGAPAFLLPGEPTVIDVEITARGETIVPGSAQVHYRYSGDEFLSAALVSLGDGQYQATLPAPACDDTPVFYFCVEGSVSGMATDPPGAPESVYAAEVGELVGFYQTALDQDPAWSTEGLWAFGTPTGNGGEYGGPDPSAGYTGVNVYGYNLDGDYEDDLLPQHLTTSAIDCSARHGVRLSFWRWLGVEQPQWDQAEVSVSNDGFNWYTIWANDSEILDLEWVLQQFDISAYADEEPIVYLRWTMGPTDSVYACCGWNIDDICLIALECE